MEISLFDTAAKGFLNLLHLKVLLAMLLGVSIGTFTAVAPQGLGMPLVYAIALPIVIKWEPITGIALLIGASSVSAICAAYLPILFGIPGGSGSQATVLDGYPMGKRGEGRRALGASFMAGGMGCLIGTVTLALAIPATRPLIYLMGSPELFVVMLWGLSMVAVLAGRRPIKGLIAAAFGLLLATVGQQAQSGIMRFVFDQPYLLDGISISIIALALFGIPSALDLALTKLGVEQQKLDAVWSYQTSPLFNAAERAALDVAVAAGCVPNAVTDEMFMELRKHWTSAREMCAGSSRPRAPTMLRTEVTS